MSYVMFVWKSPRPSDNGRDVLMLAGRGEHEGTNVTLFPAQIDAITWKAHELAKIRHDYQPPVHSLLVGESKASPQEASELAAELDRLFLRQHNERLMCEAAERIAGDAIAAVARAFA